MARADVIEIVPYPLLAVASAIPYSVQLCGDYVGEAPYDAALTRFSVEVLEPITHTGGTKVHYGRLADPRRLNFLDGLV